MERSGAGLTFWKGHNLGRKSHRAHWLHLYIPNKPHSGKVEKVLTVGACASDSPPHSEVSLQCPVSVGTQQREPSGAPAPKDSTK